MKTLPAGFQAHLDSGTTTLRLRFGPEQRCRVTTNFIDKLNRCVLGKLGGSAFANFG